MALTITYQIPGVPLINQLAEPTADGQPDENARKNCVFASNAAYATAVLHKPYWGDQLKDMDPKYGQNYTGFASEANLAGTLATLGIRATRAPAATQQGLLDIIHREVPLGHGVIVTMPSEWNSAVVDPATGNVRPGWNPRTYSGPSHVALACGVGAGVIRCMNPWGGFWHDGSDSYWSLRLLEGAVWILEYVGGGTVANIVPANWKDNGVTLVAPNGVPIVRGFRAYVLAFPGGWNAANWPLKAEYHVAAPGSIEPGNASIGPGARQDFRLGSLGWTATRNVYQIYVGQDIVALEAQLAAANAHVAQLAAQLAAVPAPTPAPAPDPKATEALAALAELAKALKLLAA